MNDRWKEMRAAFEALATKQHWDINELPGHALYLNGETQMYWEIFEAGFNAANSQDAD